MFRLFRRRKKDKIREITQKEKADPKIADVPQTSETTEEILKNSQTQLLEDFSSSETPFEEKFSAISGLITEPFPEETDIIEPPLEFLPFTKAVVETEVSIDSFVSPELFQPKYVNSEDAVIDGIFPAELPPITLEERIEGALFSIGRPIHSTELIESLQEESPLVKRTLRKVSRRRKRGSSIVIEEISKDRWVLQLNPMFHEFFQSLVPEKFVTNEERRIVTEIAYRQPISLAMVKKIVRKIGPLKITEICRNLEARGYIASEKRARSIVYTSTPKFAHDFGFDDESRRLKLQMLWRLKRLMGDYEVEEEDVEEEVAEMEEDKKKEESEVEQASEDETQIKLETEVEEKVEEKQTEQKEKEEARDDERLEGEQVPENETEVKKEVEEVEEEEADPMVEIESRNEEELSEEADSEVEAGSSENKNGENLI